ncbi:MAG: two-component system sensor histidine kinase CreC [Polaromonas sp.]|nr:MAG: two-component system sensor histidine kinase CreC [Polaromonas sp.]
MRLGIRLLFGFFLVTGLAAFFVLRVFLAEVKPSVREVMEDMLVDTANILAELASDDLAAGTMASGRFAAQVNSYALRPVDAQIWGLAKQSLDFRVYVTDVRGIVLFDSENIANGKDYSQWRDVARTLRGQYGARATREVQSDDRTSVMYVAAPVVRDGQVMGVLTVAKPMATIQAFIDRAERKILLNGLLLLALSLAIGVAVTLWVVWSIRKLRHYAQAVGQGARPAVPQVPGELGDLAVAMDTMRLKLEGHEYMEAYVLALTHELKSPLAAIRGAGELLQEDLQETDRREFAGLVLAQTGRLQAMVDNMLALSRLEQRHGGLQKESLLWRDFLKPFRPLPHVSQAFHAIEIIVNPALASVWAEPALLALALGSLLENARSFAPPGTRIVMEATDSAVSIRDFGPGVADYALPRLGERFFSTARPEYPGMATTKGSGLGLAIVKQIMVLHGGSMEVANAGPGLRVTLRF